MQDLFSYRKKGIKEYIRENRVAILCTLIFHLVVLIIMIFVRVEGLKNDMELGVMLEFEVRTIEEILAEEEIDVPEEWLEQVMRQRELASNRAVNVHSENRFSNEISTESYVQDLLEQIEQARREEDREKLEELQAILASADYVPPVQDQPAEEQVDYSGPTTITFEFMEEPRNRGKVELTVPVYRCLGSGLVTVEVEVNRDGSVSSAQIKGPVEGRDQVCFTEAALNAARSSRFRIDMNASERHRARITYTFIAQ
jgi:hypothetical protein